VEAESAAERLLTQMWSELLGIERVGVHDNFFALGGHSLLAAQLIARVREAFQIDLPLHNLFEHPTVAGLIDDIAALWGDRAVVDEIAQLFQELVQLSHEETQRLLAELRASEGEK
jgi:acyl carrier protein